MERELVSYQLAVSSAVLQEGQEDFFVLEKVDDAKKDEMSKTDSVPEPQVSNGKRISTLSFDPSRVPKGFVKKEEVKDFEFEQIQVQQEGPSDLYCDEGVFTCETCSETFDRLSSLQLHMKLHAVKNEHTYSEENTSYIDNDYNYQPSKDKSYKCSFCDRKFYTKFNLSSHVRVHTGETPYRCDLCDKRFAHGRNLHRHMKVEHKDDDKAIALCTKLLQSNNPSENRLVVYTGDDIKPFKCAVCSKTFRRLYRVKEHARTHSGQKPFQCSVCSKTFSSSDILSRHIKRLHNGGGPLQSSSQPQTDNMMADVSSQTTVIHIEGEGPVSIPMQNETGEVNFLHVQRNPDSTTSTYYIDLRTENSQLQEQEGTNAFQCSLCGKTFSSCPLLNKHIMSHKIEVPAKCHICQKTFKAESYLNRHMSTHSDERPFKCTLCPKAFYRQYRLNNHWRTHTGERPYQCTVCTKSFAVSDNMYRHIKKIHKGEGLEHASGMVKQVQELNRMRKLTGGQLE